MTPSSTDQSPFSRTAQHSAKRAAILSQAAKLFNSKGSRATTLQDIANTLGLTKTSLYYYVKTKEELIFQCYKSTIAHYLAMLDDIEAASSDPLQRLRGFYVGYFDSWLAAQEGRGPHLAALLEIASLKGAHRREIERDYIEMFRRLRDYLRDGVLTGQFRNIDTISTARAILGSVDWAFSWLHKVPKCSIPAIAEQAFDITLHGIHAGPGDYVNTPLSIEVKTDRFAQGFDRDHQNREKQLAFYKAGTWYFNTKGFSGTSLDEIAEHLNVSKGAFYYHIKNKEDLLYNCYTYSQSVASRIHTQAKALPVDGMTKVSQICRSIFRVQNSSDGPLIRYNSITALPIERRKQVLKITDTTNLEFGHFIEEGIADGSIRSVDPVVARKLLLGAINASMDIDLWRKVDDLDHAADDYFDTFFSGLVPRK